MNVNQIEIALSQKISASSTNFDLLAATKALQLLRTNGVFVVSSYGGLPAAASNEGKIYFIEDIETVVWSNGTTWLRLLDKTQFTQLFSWGSGTQNALGDGGPGVSHCSPVREFCSAIDWCQVSAGSCQSLAIKVEGSLWGWGAGSCGRLGNGTTTNKCSPVREFCSATDWCQVSAGCSHTAAVKTSGQIWSWGLNNCLQLGDGTTVSKCSPVREISSATDWCQVSSNQRHTSAVKTTGQIWAWGSNVCGRLGDGTTTDRCSPVREYCSATDWCQVSSGYRQTLAIKTSGQIWGWGGGFIASLGDGKQTPSCSPVREFCSATDWCQVNGGIDSVLAIKTSGELWGWGNNSCGDIGDGTATRRCSPVREFCSATDWCQVSGSLRRGTAVKTSGQLWAWGNNNGFGQIGDGTTIGKISPVREITSSTDWCQVSAGFYHTASLKAI